jgi:hypothetical protein
MQKLIYKFSSFVLIVMLALIAQPVIPAHAAACNSTGNGSWNTVGTWSCGHVPISTDDVTILTGNTISYNGSSTIISLTTSGTGTLNFDQNSSDSLTISGNVTNAGTIAAVNASGTRTHTMNIGGNFTNNGTLTTTSADSSDHISVVLNGTATQSIGGTTATSFYTLTISNTTAAVSAANNFSIVGTMTVNSNATFNAGTYVVSGAGTFLVQAGGTFGIGSTAGITTSGATGNIQTTTRTYTTDANYVYNGTANQAVGNGLTQNTPANVTINNPGNTVSLGAASI